MAPSAKKIFMLYMGVKLRLDRLEEWCNTKLKTLLDRQESLMIMNSSLLGGIMLLHKKGLFTDEELGEMLKHVAEGKFEEKLQEAKDESDHRTVPTGKSDGRPSTEDGDGSGTPESGVSDDESAGVPGSGDDSGPGREHEVSDDNASSSTDAAEAGDITHLDLEAAVGGDIVPVDPDDIETEGTMTVVDITADEEANLARLKKDLEDNEPF